MSTSLKILLVEDNESNQVLMMRLLGQFGYSAALAKNGAEAVEKIKQEDFDVVLMDVHMPEMDGITATRLIRQQKQDAKQPYIIAVTAEASMDEQKKYLSAGMNAYLTKPFSIEELIKLLKKVENQAEIALQPLQPAAGRQIPATQAAATERQAIDLRVLEEFRTMMGEEGEQAVKTLITLFLKDSLNLWKQIIEYTQKKEFDDLKRAAHTLKGNANQIGASALAQYCSQLEDAAKQQNQTVAITILRLMRDELAAVKNFLENYILTLRSQLNGIEFPKSSVSRLDSAYVQF